MDPKNTPNRPDTGAITPDPNAIDDAQLSLRAWMVRNGPVLLVMIVGIGAMIHFKGIDFFLSILMVGAGLGMVIFIHELGHFLVAKWCDVHVQTFSIGFGPALPGCSFTWGETTYKIALLPLGGYVKMVGEGGEGDEDDADPRSFKNKTVGQRMAIISAGVVMNVILGFIAFIVAFKAGVKQTAPVISLLEPAGPAWTRGVRTGTVVEEVDGVLNPHFQDVKIKVMLSHEGEEIAFKLRAPNEETRELHLVPRKGKTDPTPVIGVLWPMELKLPTSREAKQLKVPTRPGSPASAARILPLKQGDVVLATTDPDAAVAETLKPIDPKDVRELARRVRRLEKSDITLRVRRASGGEEDVKVAQGGFQFDDEIVGTTINPSRPFEVEELPWDARDPQGRHRDVFEFLRRLNHMAADPMVIRVERKDGSGTLIQVDLFVPPEMHRVLPGVRMEMGRVSGVREQSSAAEKGVRSADVISAIELTDGKDRLALARHPEAAKGERRLDPLRLLEDLRRWAEGRTNVVADVTVIRPQGNEARKAQTLSGLRWDSSWRFNEEPPIGAGDASLSIPELGIAFQVKSTVEDVKGDDTGLRQEDVILALWLMPNATKPDETPTFPEKPTIDLRMPDEPDPSPRWARVLQTLQFSESPRVKLLIRRASTQGEPETVTLEATLQEDSDWPRHSAMDPRGLVLIIPQERIAQAESLSAAVQLGLRHTYRTIASIYSSLKSLVTRRVSFSDSVQGPIGIALIAHETASRNWSELVLVVGIISVNLAVVNFLPIPILDGGHMVFLLYEKLRGRPASEAVRTVAMWCGLAFLVSLMVFVIYLDVVKHIL